MNSLETINLPDEEKYKIKPFIGLGTKSLSKVLMEPFVLDEHFIGILARLEKTYSVVESADAKPQIDSVVNELTETIKQI